MVTLFVIKFNNTSRNFLPATGRLNKPQCQKTYLRNSKYNINGALFILMLQLFYLEKSQPQAMYQPNF